jgi:peptidoglycan/xylan/chitin deacetylase (PgdA/CDA1 family)
MDFGPACDANKVPSGSNTTSIPRPKLGSVLYGSSGIFDCAETGTMALTFDDGPYIYTSKIVDLLKQYDAKATFFITGNNNGK